MKTYFTYLTGLILTAIFLLTLVRRSGLDEPETAIAEVSKAGLGIPPGRITMCTPQKFLLEETDKTKPVAPLFDNLGAYQFKISAASAEAQSFFNQGVKLTYGFNHAEAHRSFLEMERLDPGNAMALWGQAYALGPNINDPIPDNERRIKAFEAVEKARALSKTAPVRERELIEALAARYNADVNADLNDLNENYRREMEKLAAKYPGEIRVLSGATRAALANYTVAVSKVVARHNVTINNLLPGMHHSAFVEAQFTERARAKGTTYEQEVAEFSREWRIAAERFGDCDDVGAFVAMFCSAQANYVTGQSLVIDGGATTSTF